VIRRRHGKLEDVSLHLTLINKIAMTTTPDQFVTGFDLKEPATTTTRMAKPKSDDTVTLRGVRVSLKSDVGAGLITDLSRNKERLFSDQQVCEKYGITPNDWTAITQSKAIRLAVNAEHERRMLNNDASREAAAKEFTKAPAVLGGILEDQKANPRHRIEAAKELRATARSGDEKAGDNAERVVVTINLGSAPEDKFVFDCGPSKQNKEPPDGEQERW